VVHAALDAVRARIRIAAERAGRRVEDVRLVVTTKGHPGETALALYAEGVRDFGENRLDELAAKMPLVPADARWHFFGPLQSNKLKRMPSGIHLVHSFDRPELAAAWAAEPDRPPILLQVNMGREAQKRGVMPEAAEAALAELAAIGVACHGLMVMPPRVARPEDSAPLFREARDLLDTLRGHFPSLAILSMGTSQDFEIAIACGATMVRIGDLILGPRPGT
jgi:pyridoxal phosphate enzyme (YggS family)